MPMSKSQRAKHVQDLSTESTTSDTVKAKRLAKMTRRFVKMAARHMELFNAMFQGLSGDSLAAKQTAFFAAIAIETDGDLILHDLGELLDGITVIINDNKEDGAVDAVSPFTDADVVAYLV